MAFAPGDERVYDENDNTELGTNRALLGSNMKSVVRHTSHFAVSAVATVGLAALVSALMVTVALDRGGRSVVGLVPGLWMDGILKILKGPIKAGFPWFLPIVLLGVAPRSASGRLEVRGSVAVAALVSIYWVALGWIVSIGAYLV